MASKRGSKRIKQGRRGESVSLFSKRRSVGSPAPSPDIPHPLGELPPEAAEVRVINPQEPTAKDLREDLGDEPTTVASVRHLRKPSETAKRKNRSGI